MFYYPKSFTFKSFRRVKRFSEMSRGLSYSKKQTHLILEILLLRHWLAQYLLIIFLTTSALCNWCVVVTGFPLTGFPLTNFICWSKWPIPKNSITCHTKKIHTCNQTRLAPNFTSCLLQSTLR